ncbi:Vegetative incompatibility protein HET-E-1 [Madurella mycetomatis]|uniref:Vegetative incompatibility protein HET-E-1 n=1 Tax=Madurella mycetomatis TaxID=100816 RepID=A0A175WE93_9PEZI|nr:Vegetative incompatibility protein HET-E-1 [Madurella mycetomatis]
MKLLNTSTLHIQEFFGSDIPPYAILSHTWGDEEISFQEMVDAARHPRAKKGFFKIIKACEIEIGKRSDWIWIDTCCIDKSSSAELVEAINSMYNWYERAQVCYVYLEDLEWDDSLDPLDESLQLWGKLSRCRWFTRGWTLQELIAPKCAHFFDRKWKCIGTKGDLAEKLSTITGISKKILLGKQRLDTVSVAQKMAWASGRTTTRIEDTAYCLLGIFGVHLSLQYGEDHRAFRRLQEAIISTIPDLSVFAWRQPAPTLEVQTDSPPPRKYSGVLATTPRDFSRSGSFIKKKPSARYELLPLNGAIMARIQLLIEMNPQSGGYRYLLPLDCFCEFRPEARLCVRLRKCGYNEFVRDDPCGIVEVTTPLLGPVLPSNRYLIPDITTQEWMHDAEVDNPTAWTAIPDPIARNRSHAIQIQLPDDMWLHMVDIWPGYRFDGEDRIFYLTGGDTEHDAAVVRLRRGAVSRFGQPIEVNFECVFCALGWSSRDEKRPPQYTLLDYSKFASVLTKFRDEVRGWDFHRSLVLKRLKFHSMPRASSTVVQSRGSLVRVSFELKRVTDNEICHDGFRRAIFSCEPFDGGYIQNCGEEWSF